MSLSEARQEWVNSLRVGDIILLTPRRNLGDKDPQPGLSTIITALDGSEYSHAGFVSSIDPAVLCQATWASKETDPDSNSLSGICTSPIEEYMDTLRSKGLVRDLAAVRPRFDPPPDAKALARIADSLTEFDCASSAKGPAEPTVADYGVRELVVAALATLGRRAPEDSRIQRAMWAAALRGSQKDFASKHPARPSAAAVEAAKLLGRWRSRTGGDDDALPTTHCCEFVARAFMYAGVRQVFEESRPDGSWASFLDEIEPAIPALEAWADEVSTTPAVLARREVVGDSGDRFARTLLEWPDQQTGRRRAGPELSFSDDPVIEVAAQLLGAEPGATAASERLDAPNRQLVQRQAGWWTHVRVAAKLIRPVFQLAASTIGHLLGSLPDDDSTSTDPTFASPRLLRDIPGSTVMPCPPAQDAQPDAG